MSRYLKFGALALFCACAPPPVPGGGEPAISLLYPGSDLKTIDLQEDGTLQIFVVVEIDNLEFVSPNFDDPADVAGQGHYHFSLNDAYIDAPAHQYFLWTSTPGQFRENDRVKFSVSLASNAHRDLDQFTQWEDIREFTVGPAGGGDDVLDGALK